MRNGHDDRCAGLIFCNQALISLIYLYYTKLGTLVTWTTVAAAAICVIRTRCVFGQTIGASWVAVAVTVIAVCATTAVIINAVITIGLRCRRCAAVFGTVTLVLASLANCIAAARTRRIGITIGIITVCIGIAVIVVAISTACFRCRRRTAIIRTVALVLSRIAGLVAAGRTCRITYAV